MNREPIHIALLSDSPILQQGIQHILSTVADMHLQIFTEMDGTGHLNKDRTDLVLVNLHLPADQLSSRVEQLHGQGHSVIVMSGSDKDFDALTATQAGACGYITEEVHESEFMKAIRMVAAGHHYISATVTPLPPCPRITEREGQILEILATGATDREIASKLQISENTVHSHLDRLREKTGLRRRAELTRLALSQGMKR